MNITILTIGSRGDVQPYIALGAGLQAAGYEVGLATHENFKTWVESRGLKFFPVAGDPRATLEGEAGRKWLESGKNPITFMRRMLEAAKPAMFQIMDDYWQACQDTDLILFHTLAALPAASIVEKLGIKACPAYLHHVHPTRLYPSALFTPLNIFGGIYNRLTYSLGGEIYWRFMRPIINQWREQKLQLPPYPKKSPFGEWLKQRQPCLYGFSPYVIPRAPEWGEEINITGYWFLERPKEWRPSAKLVDFLNSGPPPVFIGFGSMTDRKPEEVTELILQALALSRQRGLLLAGWGGLGDAGLSPEVMVIDEVPFDWLFPRTAAVVHHGGAGTTASGLRAGVPSILVPYFADQPFWAWRVRQLGAGPPPVPRKKLTAERLAKAIKETVSNKKMVERAAQLGRQIQMENGVGQAVAVIRQMLASC